MGKTKTERRCEIVHDEMRRYIDPIVERARQHSKDEGTEFDEGAVNGIIKDRVAFFISQHFGVNFQMLRHYFAPNQLTVKAVKLFLSQDVPYEEVRNFYYENKQLFQQKMTELGDPVKARRVNIRRVADNAFLRIEKDGTPIWVDEIHSSAFDFFMSKEKTVEAVVLTYLWHDHYTHYDLDAKYVKCGAERLYHQPPV